MVPVYYKEVKNKKIFIKSKPRWRFTRNSLNEVSGSIKLLVSPLPRLDEFPLRGVVAEAEFRDEGYRKRKMTLLSLSSLKINLLWKLKVGQGDRNSSNTAWIRSHRMQSKSNLDWPWWRAGEGGLPRDGPRHTQHNCICSLFWNLRFIITKKEIVRVKSCLFSKFIFAVL